MSVKFDGENGPAIGVPGMTGVERRIAAMAEAGLHRQI